MAKFIELHCKENGNPILVNVDSIAFIENDSDGVYICFTMQRISSSGNSVSSHVYREKVSETYFQIKQKIEE